MSTSAVESNGLSDQADVGIIGHEQDAHWGFSSDGL